MNPDQNPILNELKPLIASVDAPTDTHILYVNKNGDVHLENKLTTKKPDCKAVWLSRFIHLNYHCMERGQALFASTCRFHPVMP